MDKKTMFATANTTQYWIVMLDDYWGFCSKAEADKIYLKLNDEHFDDSPFGSYECLAPQSSGLFDKDSISDTDIGINIVNYFWKKYEPKQVSRDSWKTVTQRVNNDVLSFWLEEPDHGRYQRSKLIW